MTVFNFKVGTCELGRTIAAISIDGIDYAFFFQRSGYVQPLGWDSNTGKWVK